MIKLGQIQTEVYSVQLFSLNFSQQVHIGCFYIQIPMPVKFTVDVSVLFWMKYETTWSDGLISLFYKWGENIVKWPIALSGCRLQMYWNMSNVIELMIYLNWSCHGGTLIICLQYHWSWVISFSDYFNN